MNLYVDLPPKTYDLLQRIVHRGHQNIGDLIRNAYDPYRPGPALELGCGTGTLSQFFAPGEYVGCDFDSTRIEEASRDHPGHDFSVGDATALEPEFLGRFPFIFCHAWVHHIDDIASRQILERIEAASRFSGRPIEMLIMEPLLPELPLANPIGYLLAKLDRGRFVRRDVAMRALFGHALYDVRLVPGPRHWPVPGGIYRLRYGAEAPITGGLPESERAR